MFSNNEIENLFIKYGIENISCVHRHRWPDHKSCFAKGLIKIKVNGTYISPQKLEKELGIAWYKLPNIRIGYFDIESDGLYADFATMLSWCVKEKGGPTVYSIIEKEELFNGVYDKRLVEGLIEELSNYDVIVGYNSTNFDLPFVRAKAMHYDIPFLSYGELYHWDLYYTVKSKLRITRKSLDNACDYLGIKGKTPIDKDIWRKAKYGDKDALEQVNIHCMADVAILEKLHDKLENTRKWIKKSI